MWHRLGLLDATLNPAAQSAAIVHCGTASLPQGSKYCPGYTPSRIDHLTSKTINPNPNLNQPQRIPQPHLQDSKYCPGYTPSLIDYFVLRSISSRRQRYNAANPMPVVGGLGEEEQGLLGAKVGRLAWRGAGAPCPVVGGPGGGGAEPAGRKGMWAWQVADG